jgi:hypothetical protein
MRDGVVEHLVPGGPCILREAGTRSYFAFTLDRIEGLDGRHPREVGLRAGAPVRFEAEGCEAVRLRLVEAPSA